MLITPVWFNAIGILSGSNIRAAVLLCPKIRSFNWNEWRGQKTVEHKKKTRITPLLITPKPSDVL